MDTAGFEARLRARKAELEKRLDEIEHDLVEEPHADSEERATEREGDEVLEDLGQAAVAELRAIDAALQRIEDGTFGECVRCGDEIAPERLDVVPHAPLCHSCAR